MFQFLKDIPTALIVLSFCFFISALAGEQEQKSSNTELNPIVSQDQFSIRPLPIFPDTLRPRVIPPRILRQVPVPTEPRVVQLKKGVALVNPNIQMHPNPTTTQSGISITTHPLNPDIVLAGSNAADISVSFVSLGWYYSTDGGSSWTGGDTFPTHSNLSKAILEPAPGIDLDGNLFFSAFYYTLSNPVGDPRELFVARSTDNGSTWTQQLVPNSTTREDRDHFAVDVNPGSPYENYLYTAFTNLKVSPWTIVFSRSTDRGASFSNLVSIGGSVLGLTGGLGVNLAVGPNSELYTTWIAYDVWPPSQEVPTQLGFNKSTNGGASWETAQSIRTVLGLPFLFNKSEDPIRIVNFPSMAVDRSAGTRRDGFTLCMLKEIPQRQISF